MQMTGAQIIVASLQEQGTEVVFGYPGGSVLNIYDALYEKRETLRHILSSHEQGAAHAADGYSRSTGKTGVVIATSGPGATNLVTGLATAYLDSIPMVAITGNVTKELLGRDSFQEVDITGVTVPVTKHNFFVKDAEQLASTIREAFVIANSGRPGPVLIDIPKDVTAQVVEYQPAGAFQLRPLPTPDTHAVEQAAGLIAGASRPLIYFGGGVTASGAGEALMKLAEKIHAPLVTSAMGLSAIPYNFPMFLGMIGMHGTPAANRAVCRCDLLLAVGARFSDRVVGNKNHFASGAKVVQIDIDLSEIGKNVFAQYGVVGDAREVLETLLATVPAKNNLEWSHELLSYKALHPVPESTNDQNVDARDVLHAIRQVTQGQAIIATDVGQHQMITAQHYRFTRPRTFLSSCGLGTMGYGMGAAVGAKVGNPESPVALITGDGCFHMNMNELAMAVTEELPLVVFIMNNGVLGMVRQWQKLFYKGRYSSTTLNRKTDFVKLAEAMGATGLRITCKDEILPTVEKAFAQNGPVVVDCIIHEDDAVFPIIPPGGSQKDMIFYGD